MITETVVTPIKVWRYRKRLGTEETRLRRIEESPAMGIVLYETGKLYRKGFVDFYYRVETVKEHKLDCADLWDKASGKLGFSTLQRLRGRVGFKAHELDEAIRLIDEPQIRPSEMRVRSKLERLAYQLTCYVPTREEAVAARRAKFDKYLPLYTVWVNEHVEADLCELWLDLLREFHYVETPLAMICFEIHALQPFKKAVEMAELGTFDPPDIADAFLRRNKPLITIPILLELFEDLERRLEKVKMQRDSDPIQSARYLELKKLVGAVKETMSEDPNESVVNDNELLS